MLLTCQAIFGRERGAELSAFLEHASGEPCPCRQGRPCPLMPADQLAPAEVPLPTPRVRSDVGRLRPVAAAAIASYGLAAVKIVSASF